MKRVTHEMSLIQQLDHNAALHLSNYTIRWFVSARLGISNGVLWHGIAEHHDTPEEAVSAYLLALQSTQPDEFVVYQLGDVRHEYRWSGVMWLGVDREPVS